MQRKKEYMRTLLSSEGENLSIITKYKFNYLETDKFTQCLI